MQTGADNFAKGFRIGHDYWFHCVRLIGLLRLPLVGITVRNGIAAVFSQMAPRYFGSAALTPLVFCLVE